MCCYYLLSLRMSSYSIVLYIISRGFLENAIFWVFFKGIAVLDYIYCFFGLGVYGCNFFY